MRRGVEGEKILCDVGRRRGKCEVGIGVSCSIWKVRGVGEDMNLEQELRKDKTHEIEQRTQMQVKESRTKVERMIRFDVGEGSRCRRDQTHLLRERVHRGRNDCTGDE